MVGKTNNEAGAWRHVPDWTMGILKEGIKIPVTHTHISLGGQDDKDNPICEAIVEYLEQNHNGDKFSAFFCFIDEKVSIFRKDTGKRFADFYTTTMLEDWLRAYFNGKSVNPFQLRIFQQRDDTDQIESEHLWIGIIEFNLGDKVYRTEEEIYDTKRIWEITNITPEGVFYLERKTAGICFLESARVDELERR